MPSPTSKRSPSTSKNKRSRGGQPTNNNAARHGFYSPHFSEPELDLILQFCADPTLDDEIIMQRVANFRLVESLSQETEGEIKVRMFEALSTGLGRVAKLLRDKRALSGDAADGIAGAIAAALDELKTEIGLDV